MLLLPDKPLDIKVYTLPAYPPNLVYAKVYDQLWDSKFLISTLTYIEVSRNLRGQGLSYRLLDLITKENPYLWFKNFNLGFWARLSLKSNLPYEISLRNGFRGEIIRKCECCYENKIRI